MIQRVKKVMVTGGSGFVGRYCLRRLLDRGFEVHAISSRAMADDVPGGIRWHRFDLLDLSACNAAIQEVRPTHLLHLAWIATPGVFWDSPDNLRWLVSGVDLVRAFYAQGGQRALGVGTCAEYSWRHGDCNEATTPLTPSNVYGRCKLALSLAFEAAAMVSGGTSAWARLFFPYGPGEPPDRLIPTVIRGLLKGEAVSCTHGRQVRDFIFVEDAADALAALLDSQVTGALNIGSGEATTLREVVSVITARLDRPELVQFGARPAPRDDPERVVADIGRLAHELGWRPAVTLNEGIERSIAAWRQRIASSQNI